MLANRLLGSIGSLLRRWLELELIWLSSLQTFARKSTIFVLRESMTQPIHETLSSRNFFEENMEYRHLLHAELLDILDESDKVYHLV